jgi:glycosyltransferase involved in cell wall biosynthesis
LLLGGTELSILYLIEKIYKKYNIIIAYSNENSNLDMIIRLSKYAKVMYLHKPIQCDLAIYCSFLNFGEQNLISASNSKEWCHATIIDVGYNKNSIKKRIGMEEYIAVSNEVKKQMIECGYEADKIRIIHNELNPNIEKLAEEKVKLKRAELNLVTVSRITSEKGFERMLQLARYLKSENKDFIWYIVGDNTAEYGKKITQDFKSIPECIFVGQKENPFPYIKNADVLVQLSQRESWCNSISEARLLGKPVICTNFKSHEEQIKDGVNGIVLDMNMTNMDKVKNIKELKSDYTQKDEWKKWNL